MKQIGKSLFGCIFLQHFLLVYDTVAVTTLLIITVTLHKQEFIVFFITIAIQINSPLNFHLYIQNMVSYLPLRYVPNTI